MAAGVFANLIAEGEVGRVTLVFNDVIIQSFVDDKSRVTGDEVKRRFDMLCEIFKQLRGDLKWSLPRCFDYLPKYLRCKIDRAPYDPTTESLLWTPDGAKIVGDKGAL